MTESEAIKICNTIGFAASFSNPQGISLNTTKAELTEAMIMSIQALEKQKAKKMVIKNDNGRTRCACGRCGCFVLPASRFCSKCGQKLDWSDEE